MFKIGDFSKLTRITGPNREIYLKTPDQPGGDGLMELQYPVAKG